MVQFHLFQNQRRSNFKKLITSYRSHTTETQNILNHSNTLSEMSERSIQKQNNKKIHNLSKQTFITNKKQFLLSRKSFYNSKPKETKIIQMNNLREENKVSVYANFMESQIKKEDLFSIEKEIMKNPLFFHRNMIVKVKDNEQTKNILKKWYKNSKSSNGDQFRKTKEQETKRLNDFQQYKSDKQIKYRPSILFRTKMNLFQNQKLRSSKIKIHERSRRKYESLEQKESCLQDSEKLLKLIIRVQPFWQKARLKI